MDARLADVLTERIRAGDRERVLALVSELHSADLADLIHHLPFADANALVGWLHPEQGAEVVAELDDELRGDLLEDDGTIRISELLDAMDTDDAADVLADLPQEVAQEVLPRLEDAEEVEELLAYHEETAGGLMATEYVAVSQDWTVAQATEEVRRKAIEVDPVYVVYVVDPREKLLGMVPLKRLLLAPASSRISAVMDPELISVDPHEDQEEVARIMERYDLVVLPVVDEGGKLLGRITIDDVVDVIREEAEEDIALMSGSGPDEDLSTSVLKVSKGRLVWLMVGLGGALLSALVINSFQAVLEEALVLAMFIPVVMAMAGNAGIQSSAISVQGLASGRLWPGELLNRFAKELLVALVNGIVLSLVFGVLIVVLQSTGILVLDPGRSLLLAMTVGMALLAVIVLAATMGAVVPLILERMGIDPALATGPFITTSNDIMGLVVYFLVATTLYL
jgi:magnesium transporter